MASNFYSTSVDHPGSLALIELIVVRRQSWGTSTCRSRMAPRMWSLPRRNGSPSSNGLMLSPLKLDPPTLRIHHEGRVAMVLSPFWSLDAKGEKRSISIIRGICNGKSQARSFFDVYACELDFVRSFRVVMPMNLTFYACVVGVWTLSIILVSHAMLYYETCNHMLILMAYLRLWGFRTLYIILYAPHHLAIEYLRFIHAMQMRVGLYT